jgi:hypothetical protein
MALTQNLLDFTSGYSFCDINRVFAYQIGARLEFERRILARNGPLMPKTGQPWRFLAPVDVSRFSVLKKR